jgi:DNA-binding transcriptional ArsR family regulator
MQPARARAEIDDAVLSSSLRPLSRDIVWALSAVYDDELGGIPPGCQPSLTELAAWTGMHRASVKRHLNRLEKDEQVRVQRDRPSPRDARRHHYRTHYTILIPDELGAGGAGAGRSQRHGLGAGSARLGAGGAGAGRSQRQELGAGSARLGAGSATRDDDDKTSSARPWDDDDLVSLAMEELNRASGRTVSTEQACDAVRQITEGRDVRRPIPYIRRAIREDPRRYLPTAEQPRYERGPEPERPTREQIQAVRRQYEKQEEDE